eukprot:scaffold163559_cov34-Prasinocladus_malaysianus.AAC.1
MKHRERHKWLARAIRPGSDAGMPVGTTGVTGRVFALVPGPEVPWSRVGTSVADIQHQFDISNANQASLSHSLALLH